MTQQYLREFEHKYSMPFYVYKAKNSSTQTLTGRIEAQNQDEALDLIHRQGLVPVSIEEQTAQGVLISGIRRKRIKTRELYQFTRQLSGLIKSGTSLPKALEVMSISTKN